MRLELSQPNPTTCPAPPAVEAVGGWRAELQLDFAPIQGTTRVVRHRHTGPLLVQRPFHPEGPVCHVYVLHPPGGVVARDELVLGIDALEGSAALVTTPAAAKFYRSGGGTARQSVTLRVATGASLEWLPQETIYYQGARAASRLSIELDPDARFIGWDIITLGRPAAAERFDTGEVSAEVQLVRAGRPVLVERTLLDPEAFRAPWGLAGLAACGTLWVSPGSRAQLEAVRALIGERAELGVTLIGNLLVCRGRDRRADRLRAFFQQVWACVRADVIGRRACAPRIWAT